jgi:uncharacterized coiled-coil protein SlyX
MQNEQAERLADVETRMTFLERLVDELNLVVTQQHDRIDELERQFRELRAQAQSSALESDTSKPPHY